VVQPPAGVQGEPREWLRDQHSVRPLEARESGLEISETPPGIFGFVSGLNLVFFSRVTLGRSHDFGDDFELHKLVDGSVYVIGFVGIDIADLLRRDVWPQKINFTFYSDAWDNADKIVALPLDEERISKRFRSIELDNGTHLEVLDITMD